VTAPARRPAAPLTSVPTSAPTSVPTSLPTSPPTGRGAAPSQRRRSDDRRSDDRRGGERRAGQAAVLHHRRATDRRLDLAGADLQLQRRAFAQRLAEQPVVIDLVERLPETTDDEPVVDLVRCPLCEVLHDRLWLFAHVARDHRAG
jgi:hypothetical protein